MHPNFLSQSLRFSLHPYLIVCLLTSLQGCLEVRRLARERPSWLSWLDIMFRHITVDPTTMVSTVAEGEDEEDGDEDEDAADQEEEGEEEEEEEDDDYLGNAQQTNLAAPIELREHTPLSSSRKRGSSGPTSTAEVGSKRSKNPVLGCWSNLQQGLHEHTSIVKQGLEKLVQKDDSDAQEINLCFNLVKQCGVSSHCPEYFKVQKLFRDSYWRGRFLAEEDDDARRNWINNVDHMM